MNHTPEPGHQPSPEPAPAFVTYPPEANDRKRKGNGNGLLVGLAIGALVGGIAGGGTAAIIGANAQNTVGSSGAAQTVTITNPENATAVSAIADVATDSVVTLEVSSPNGSGSGSGVIYSDDGYIITNAHVVTMPGASLADTYVRVLLSDGSIIPASIVGTDPYADIAVVKIEAEGLTPIRTADSSELSVGDLTVAIGAPFHLSGTVTSGVVSALNRGISVGSPLLPSDPELDEGEDNPWDFQFDIPGEATPQTGGQVTLPVIQTDADINPGNSGGALLNGEGELIGVNVAIASIGRTEEAAGSVGLGFAIPANLAIRVADEIIDGETPSHGLLGASVGDSRMDDQATQRGGLVTDVVPGSAAEAAEIRAGDIITSVNGVSATHGTAVSALIRYHEGGSEVELGIERNGEFLTKTVTLGTLDW